MLQLKPYQQRALDMLASFFADCRKINTDQEMNIDQAFKQALQDYGFPTIPYQNHGLGDIPYVCLRIPTGGGKTILGSYAIIEASKYYLYEDFPLVMWFVPSNAIRMQTINTLKNANHPYRKCLDKAFNYQLSIFNIDEVEEIRPQDIGNKTIIVVSTLQNLRVENTSGRKIYAYREIFEPHFSLLLARYPDAKQGLERVGDDDLKEHGLTNDVLGHIKYSFVNLLAIKKPLVIMDEAHNARTKLTFSALQRIHPQAIIELTATPDTSPTSGSNILFSASATELKQASMIKFPIRVTEHQHWQAAVGDAIREREQLANIALQESRYIRPIVLFQAENKNGSVTVDVLKQHLITEHKIDEKAIAIATANQHQLDGIDLKSPTCPICYIITIEALKEGWDCSFAYILCSVKHVKSIKDAEQLLGRVMRLPYANHCHHQRLNYAYAHLASEHFSQAVVKIKDSLIDMGFNRLEIAKGVEVPLSFTSQQSLSSSHDEMNDQLSAYGNDRGSHPLILSYPNQEDIDLDSLSPAQKAMIRVEQQANESVVIIRGHIDEKIQHTLINNATNTKQKKMINQQIIDHNRLLEQDQTIPAEQAIPFAPIPQLCIFDQREWQLLDHDHWLTDQTWSLTECDPKLEKFTFDEKSHTFEIFIDGKRIKYRAVDINSNYHPDLFPTTITVADLAIWLEQEVRRSTINYHDLNRFLTTMINDLINSHENITLTLLQRHKYHLVDMARQKINQYYQKLKDKFYDQLLSDPSDIMIKTSLQYPYDFSFGTFSYPLNQAYQGSYQFQKHYYSSIDNLIEDGEEFHCAQCIDRLPQVKYWIRNLVKKEQASFKLPTRNGYFYPDFIVELHDGRILIVEYKGQHLIDNENTKNKEAIGSLWAKKSNGQCLFVMVSGRDVKQQLSGIVEN